MKRIDASVSDMADANLLKIQAAMKEIAVKCGLDAAGVNRADALEHALCACRPGDAAEHFKLTKEAAEGAPKGVAK